MGAPQLGHGGADDSIFMERRRGRQAMITSSRNQAGFVAEAGEKGGEERFLGLIADMPCAKVDPCQRLS